MLARKKLRELNIGWTNAGRYPVLAQIARDYLPVQGSSTNEIVSLSSEKTLSRP